LGKEGIADAAIGLFAYDGLISGVEINFPNAILDSEGEAVGPFHDVMKRIDPTGDTGAQSTRVLEWVSGVLEASGAALIRIPRDVGPPESLASIGSLSGLGMDGAVKIGSEDTRWEPDSMVQLTTRGGEKIRCFYHPFEGGPLKSHAENAAAAAAAAQAILLTSETITYSATLHRDELAFAGFLLDGIRERALLKEQLVRERTFISLLVEKKITSGPDAVNPGFDLITEGLDLPLYLCTTAGAIIYASPSFLRLVGYSSVEEMRKCPDFFLDPQSRMAELGLLRSQGKVSSYPLGVKAGGGRRLEIQESAVIVGAFAFGVFIDVTGFLSANKELKEALEVQELLNDRFMAGTQILQRTQATSIRALARLAEFRDQETGFHLQRMCEYTRMIAQQVYERKPYSFHLTASYPTDISLSSMLHDIGKVCIPDSILMKKGTLDTEEWSIMKKHTTAGWEILHRADKELGEQSFLTLASTIALSHHERYDGKGYPAGLAGEKIPLSARISALADVYDALTTDRPYKEAWDHEKACEEIVKNTGTQFDPVLVDIFLSMEDDFDGIRRIFPG
jgi:HD-GYP domain-containing protein (c-di-GMP phosphodiesterase class II)